MRYRVVVGGLPVECGTIEDLLTLIREAGGTITEEATRQSAKPGGVASIGSRWTETRMRDFLGYLKGNQRKLIDELLEHPEGRTDEQLCTVLGLNDGRRLAGVLTGLWKNAKKVGADPNDVYKKQHITLADRKMFEYTLSESFRGMAKEVRAKAKK